MKTPSKVMIKISGESLSTNSNIFDFEQIYRICQNIKRVIENNISVCLTIGGGNIIRGKDFRNNQQIAAESADNIGMLATVMNGLIFRDILNGMNLASELVSPLDLPFGIKKLNSFNIREIEQNKILIFIGGVGLPYFSSDTVTAIGALLSRSDLILKATKTDGIYNKDPLLFPDAVHLPHIHFDEAIQNQLAVMDEYAFIFAKKYRIPILVFSMFEEDCFIKAIKGTIKHSLCD